SSAGSIAADYLSCRLPAPRAARVLSFSEFRGQDTSPAEPIRLAPLSGGPCGPPNPPRPQHGFESLTALRKSKSACYRFRWSRFGHHSPHPYSEAAPHFHVVETGNSFAAKGVKTTDPEKTQTSSAGSDPGPVDAPKKLLTALTVPPPNIPQLVAGSFP